MSIDIKVRAIQVRSPDQDFLKFNLLNILCRTDSLHNLISKSGVITKSGEQIEAMSIAPPDVYSDHSLIIFGVSRSFTSHLSLSPVKSECGGNSTQR